MRGDAELVGDELPSVVGVGTDQDWFWPMAAIGSRPSGLAGWPAQGRELAGTGHDALGSAVTVGAEQRGVGPAGGHGRLGSDRWSLGQDEEVGLGSWTGGGGWVWRLVSRSP